MSTEVEAKAVSTGTAAAMYQVGKDAIEKAIHTGALPAKKLGGVLVDGELKHFRYRIGVDDLARWFASLPEA